MTTDSDGPGLRDLADVEEPEVVRSALRRFRRRAALLALVVVAATVGVVLVLTAPQSQPSLPARFDPHAGQRVGAVVNEPPVEVVMLSAQRLDDDTFGLELIVLAEGLEEDEALFASPVAPASEPNDRDDDATSTESPPPGPPVFGGIEELASDGFGPGPVTRIWLGVPVETTEVSFVVATAVPANPGSGPSPGQGRDGPPAVSDAKERVLVDEPPTEPGTTRVLADMELDLEELGVEPGIRRSRR